MTKGLILLPVLCAALVACVQTTKQEPISSEKQLQSAIAHPARDSENIKRDPYRNPYQTLRFFEVEPTMKVLEVSPGKGWYTEILGPYLKDKGELHLATFAQDTSVEYFKNANAALKEKMESHPEAYGKVVYTTLQIPDHLGPFAEENSLDRILTFRNVHNWTSSGKADQIFKSFYKALKPGGILGVVDHRAKSTTKDLKSSGYILEADVVKLAEAAGFKLVEKSEINANTKDTTNHPKGVWTLPPTLRLGDKDKQKYIEIGESDRMTLKFVKESKTH